MKLLQSLQGYRTYIIAVVIAVLNLLVATGVVSPDHLTQINFILGALGLGTLRSAVNRQ